ncbi:protoporphyrinogen/coproporphyrinogen oxidase [Acidipropionibacterium virtanenii]|uniref:Protoporphyrinogen oxidase n=1 Tax=Acidipropionibacterium virtanenii TaxID=2057246 RepID=A0A344URJ2_9ACTN|nr:FAD-dependent oxidoreductase [Acidipropionibacterium virtanenii]AXE37890.1 Protoporphyrinogen oxidase [Acidipropionibacterium virtanenii]
MRRVDAVVIGGGMAGLVAAWQFTREGLTPVLLESRGYTGGLVAASKIAGVAYDIGAEGWAVRRPETAELAAELGLDVEFPRPAPSWVWFDDGPFAMPSRAILGIPADLSDSDVVAALGAGEAEKAARLDGAPLPDELPPDLGSLVEQRMGTTVLERLVAPIAGGIHAADPHLLATEVVSPGLLDAVRRAGSLAGGVALVKGDGAPKPPVASVAGGMFRMPQVLHEQISAADGQVLTRTGARALERDGEGWVVRAAATVRNENPSLPPVPCGEPVDLAAARVVIACSAGPARRLLGGVVDVSGPELVPGAPIAHVNLAVRAPELDAGPRGNGMLVARGSQQVSAKALTHLSAKWPSLTADCRARSEGLHLLRVSYGRSGEAEVELSVGQAMADASTLLGVELAADRLVDHQIIHWSGALAPTTPAARAWVQGLHEQLSAVPGIGLTGAWASGSGIAALVPHARDTARRLA